MNSPSAGSIEVAFQVSFIVKRDALGIASQA